MKIFEMNKDAYCDHYYYVIFLIKEEETLVKVYN